MTINTSQLPDDVDALKAIVGELQAENADLRHNLEVYRRMAFGPSSEKRRSDDLADSPAGQGHLFASQLVAEAERVSKEREVEGSIETKPASKPKAKSGRRRRFPDHLPQVHTRYELPEEQQLCSCGGELHEIGVERTKELERLETSIVHEIQRAKYACRQCEEGVVTAPGPDRVIDKGLLGPGFLAHVITDRFGDHMPYHRLEKKYAREGLDLSRSVLERSVATCSELLEPIWEEIKRRALQAPAIHTDDTPVTIARGSSGKSHKGYVWIYLDQEGRHFYDFTDSRKRDGPLSVLEGYRGFIHADAYPGYDAAFVPNGATEVACWAHARRKFVDAEKTDPDLAKPVVEAIGQLYAVERQAKEQDLDVDGRLALRQRVSVPLLDHLQAQLGEVEAKVLPKSPLGRAVSYAQAQWQALRVYTMDGRLGIDNNPAERALRPFAVGRKNWLFVQNEKGGKRAAILMSLVMTAKAIGLNPTIYLRDLLIRIARESDVAKLTPHGWKEHFAKQVAAEHEVAVARLTGR